MREDLMVAYHRTLLNKTYARLLESKPEIELHDSIIENQAFDISTVLILLHLASLQRICKAHLN
jgi:hypothetical protein